MNKTVAAYCLSALVVSILSIVSVAVSAIASLDLLVGTSALFNTTVEFVGALLAAVGVSIALPINHSGTGIRFLQAYLYPAVVCIVGVIVGRYFVETNIDTRIASLVAVSGACGFLIRPWLSRYFAELPRWVHLADAGRQVVTMVIVIFGFAFRLYAWTAI